VIESPYYEYLRDKMRVAPEHLEQLVKDVPKKSVAKAEYLLMSGQTCHHTFFVEKGLLRLFDIDEKGKEHMGASNNP
jgi:CRP/FNR family transcriptional regulator, anaerobic regulatory protein